MTPGLQEYVLDGEEEGTGGTALSDALAPAFSVVEDRGTSAVRRLTWLDTFDWRLNRAGLVLAHEQARRTGRLLLTAADGTPLAEQPAPAAQPRRPSLNLPAGPVSDRIAALVSPRALLPIARAVSTVSVSRLLNEDGKTVARLLADAARVTDAARVSADACEVDLPVRLTVAEVRGYPGQARRAARLLAEAPGMSAATQSAFAAALQALHRRPGDYSGAVDAEITAGMPAPVAVATLLLRLLDTLEQNIDGDLRDIDTEFLHDLRVSVRRTRSAIKLLGDVLPGDLADQYAAEFKWLGDLTTPTRDLDVYLLGFDSMAASLLAAKPADLEPFRAFLARRRAREFRGLAAAIRSPRFRTATEHWRKALVEVRDARPPKSTRNPRNRPLTAADLAISRTERAYRRIITQGRAINQDSAPESLHDLRKRGKELRYMLEFFAPLHDPVAYRKVISDLKQLQDVLGEFQDSEVQREEIHALADAILAERSAPAATLLAMGELAARLAVSQAEARADFSRRFSSFAGPASLQRFNTLLGVERVGRGDR
jgi:CHAD domain-containing protein